MNNWIIWKRLFFWNRIEMLKWFIHLLKKFCWRCGAYEAGNVYVNKCSHQKLAVESVHYSTMTWNHISKVLQRIRKMWVSPEEKILNYSKYFTFILKARLNPDAKKPPNGPITELKMLIDNECKRNGYIVKVLWTFPYKRKL